MGLVFAAIVGVYRGAGVYMVPLWYRSILREKCVTGVKDACGMLVMCEGFMGNAQGHLREGACYPTTGVCVGVL